tara:strand:+ start:1030 stop:1176 length:147 start_codon:yes stop_codon:yes gene_type:complete
MLQTGIMLRIAAAVFWWLHLYLAIAVGVVIVLLVAASSATRRIMAAGC